MEVKTRQLAILMMAMFIFTLGFGIIIPILPYYSRSLGATATDMGLLMASFSLMQFIFAPIWGKVSDRYGRKPVLAIGLFGFGFSFILYGLSTELWMLFISRILGGILSAGIFPASLAFIADVSRPEERGKLMGIMGAASGLGIICGPVISGVVSYWGIAMPFFVAGAISILTMIAGYALLPETLKPGVKGEKKKKMSYSAAIASTVGVFLLLTLFISFAIACFEGTFAFFIMDKFELGDQLKEFSVLGMPIWLTGPGFMSVLFAVMGVIGVICQGFLVGKSIKTFGEEKTIVGGLAICAIGLFLVPLSSGVLSLLAYAAIIGIGSGLIRPSLNTIISNNTDMEHQGVMMGILGSFDSMGRIFGPPAGGFIYDRDHGLPYIISGLLLAAGAVAVVLVRIRRRGRVKVAPEPMIRGKT